MRKFEGEMNLAGRSRLLVLAGLILLVLALPALAASGGPYNLFWDTWDGGGQSSSGGSYVVVGTIGQPDAGPEMTGGSYALAGGFWYGGVVVTGPPGGGEIYLPVVVK